MYACVYVYIYIYYSSFMDNIGVYWCTVYTVYVCVYDITIHHRFILPIISYLSHYDSIPSHPWLERTYPGNISPPKVRDNSLIPCVQSNNV